MVARAFAGCMVPSHFARRVCESLGCASFRCCTALTREKEGKVFSSLSSEDKLLSDVIGNDKGSCGEDRLEQEAEA